MWSNKNLLCNFISNFAESTFVTLFYRYIWSRCAATIFTNLGRSGNTELSTVTYMCTQIKLFIQKGSNLFRDKKYSTIFHSVWTFDSGSQRKVGCSHGILPWGDILINFKHVKTCIFHKIENKCSYVVQSNLYDLDNVQLSNENHKYVKYCNIGIILVAWWRKHIKWSKFYFPRINNIQINVCDFFVFIRRCT